MTLQNSKKLLTLNSIKGVFVDVMKSRPRFHIQNWLVDDGIRFRTSTEGEGRQGKEEDENVDYYYKTPRILF